MKQITLIVFLLFVQSCFANGNSTLRDPLIGERCGYDHRNRYNFKCGSGTDCVNGVCVCEFGYVAQPNKVDCVEVRCHNDYDCDPVINSRCNYPYYRCVCEDGYETDFNTATCVRPASFYLTVIGVSAAVVLIGAVGLVVYRRLRRT